MLIDWTKFLAALLFLLPPIALFHDRRVRYRALTHGWSGYWIRTFSLGLHTIDFGRATLGAWWLTNGVVSAADVPGSLFPTALLVQAAVLATAVTLQTLVCKQPVSAHAPLAFVSGMVAGFLPPFVAGFSLLLAWVAAMGIRSFSTFFSLLSLTLVVTGLFFAGTKLLPTLIILAGVVVLPKLLTLLFPRRLVLSYLAKGTSSSGHRVRSERR